MLLARIVGLLAAIGIGAGIVAFLLTRDRRYLGFAGRIARYALMLALVYLVLLFLERVIAL